MHQAQLGYYDRGGTPPNYTGGDSPAHGCPGGCPPNDGPSGGRRNGSPRSPPGGGPSKSGVPGDDGPSGDNGPHRNGGQPDDSDPSDDDYSDKGNPCNDSGGGGPPNRIRHGLLGLMVPWGLQELRDFKE